MSTKDAPTQSTGWQPIATAPHGQLVLFYGPEAGKGVNRQAIGMFCHSWGGWWTHSINGMMKTCYVEPTHWQPLPEPPL